MEEIQAVPDLSQPPSSRRRLVALVVVLVGIVLLGVLVLPFLNVLFNILIPPSPPLPNVSLTEVSHQNYDYGVDEWIYNTNVSACDLLQYYQSLDIFCAVTPLSCGRSQDGTDDFAIQNTLVARCEGRFDFSLFSMDWWVLVQLNPDDPSLGRLDIWREINWLSNLPQATQ